MAHEITMPQLGLTMTEGTIQSWVKKVGDTVTAGEVLAEIQTDKISTELESEVSGVLLAIFANEGDDIPVQGLLCIIGEAGEQYEKTASAPAAVTDNTVATTPVSSAEAPVTPAVMGTRIRISPLAKKTALAHRIDYSNISGSGPGGRIIQRDILAAASATPATIASTQPEEQQGLPSGNVKKMSPMRKVVAERMTKSHSEIPAVTQTIKVNVTALLEFRTTINANREVRFSINDLVLKAIAKALAANPHMLVSLRGTDVIHHDAVHIGMAVALPEGLIVPVIKNADLMNLETLAATTKDLATRARSSSLSVDEYQGSTFSVSNLGMYGIESFTPIINQPDAAIMGICSIEDELALHNEQVIQQKIMRLSLTYDHRLMDGASAAKFQQYVKKLLESPLDIVL